MSCQRPADTSFSLAADLMAGSIGPVRGDGPELGDPATGASVGGKPIRPGHFED